MKLLPENYRICTAVKLNATLRNVLIHPKDGIGDEKKPEVIKKIQCNNCEHVCVGETGRLLRTRVKEHCKEVYKITGIFTGAGKIRTASTCNKSVITDRVCNENHVIDRENVKGIDQESDKTGRFIKEAMWIRKTSNMNQDNGSYQLSHIQDKLLHINVRHQKSALLGLVPSYLAHVCTPVSSVISRWQLRSADSGTLVVPTVGHLLCRH